LRTLFYSQYMMASGPYLWNVIILVIRICFRLHCN